MVESAAVPQLQGSQIEQGHLELAGAIQPPILVVCGRQWQRVYTRSNLCARASQALG